MLEVRNISAGFGPVTVLHDVSLRVGKGEMVALVGGNGAGKTTLMKCIAGLLVPTGGSVVCQGVTLAAGAPAAAVAAGVVLVPEGRMAFPRMTVLENLLLGGINPRARPHRAANLGAIYTMFPRLRERQAQAARTLSGGEQQMLAIGRGLMAMPDVLILDEPSLGLSPIMVKETFVALRDLNRKGLTILLVEQNVRLSLTISARGYVLENGRVVLSGPSDAIGADPLMRKAYLGM